MASAYSSAMARPAYETAVSPESWPLETVVLTPRSLSQIATCPAAELSTVFGNSIGFTRNGRS